MKIVLLFLVSYCLSAFWIVANPQTRAPKRPDAIIYERIASNLANGDGFSFDRSPPFRPEITRSPFLPVMAAGVYVVFGRYPSLILWLNAVLIGIAVALGYVVARDLLGDTKAAYLGAWIACLTPQVSTSASTFLTEAPAILQVVLISWLLINWPRLKENRWALPIASTTGLVMASLVLNRTNFTPIVIAAVSWITFETLRSRWQSTRAWLTVGLLCLSLGAPVLAWSARNASHGLGFAPMAAGGGAGYVYEVNRYRYLILDANETIPESNSQFWLHYLEPMGPDQLIEIDRQNMEWFKELLSERWDRALLSIPRRVLSLFSNSLVCVYRQPWPLFLHNALVPIIRWTSRILWCLSFIGFILLFHQSKARWIWLLWVGGLVLFHSFTSCNPRYMTSIVPLAIPYGGVTLVWIFNAARQKLLKYQQS
ncbi:MAG: hypothetical protein GY847_27550 [Proteobacteria bacterium]|nr:hypothetical protein [Pseudomonadota bacterium]